MRFAVRFMFQLLALVTGVAVSVVAATAVVAAPGGSGKGPKTTTTTTTTMPTVAVTLRITEFERVSGRGPSLVTLPAPRRDDSCRVVVPSDSSGVKVLAAALESGCLESYELAAGHYAELQSVRCVDGTCNTSVGWRQGVDQWLWGGGVEWALFNESQRIWYLHEFSAKEGAALTLAYQPTGGACILVPTGSTFECFGVSFG